MSDWKPAGEDVFAGPGGGEILSGGRHYPVSSKIEPNGSLAQMGISGEGFQREMGIHRHTEIRKGGGYDFCWEMTVYQHPGCRKVIPLGCARAPKSGVGQAPAEAKRLGQALHNLAKAGFDPTEARGPHQGGIERGRLWHQFVGQAVCGGGDLDLKEVRKHLRDHGLWPR